MEAVEESIIRFLLKEPKKCIMAETIAEMISSRKAKHSRASIFRYCGRLLQNNVLKAEKIGRARLVSIDFASEKAIAIISELESGKKAEFLRSIEPALREYFMQLCNRIRDKCEIHSALVFGSYAKGKQRAESDIDIMFIIALPDIAKDRGALIKETKSMIGAVLSDIEPYLNGIRLSPAVLELSGYVPAIKEGGINIVTESFREHIILKNPFGYWESVAGALQ